MAYSLPVRLVPIGGSVIGVLTLFICLGISQGLHHSTGGLTVPYISDTGRDPPERYVFAVGLSICGLLYASTGILNARLLVIQDIGRGLKGLSITTGVLSALAGIFLSLLSILNDKDFPDEHEYCAIVMFICSFFFIIFTAVIYYTLWKRERESLPRKRSMIYKVVVSSVFLVSFVLYLPVGLSIDCAFVQDPNTGLYDYSNCIGLNTLRTVTQWITVISLIVYLAGFYIDFSQDVEIKE